MPDDIMLNVLVLWTQRPYVVGNVRLTERIDLVRYQKVEVPGTLDV